MANQMDKNYYNTGSMKYSKAVNFKLGICCELEVTRK